MAITDKHFGSVYSGFPQDGHYEAVQAELGTAISRWPGGFLAEERIDVYDIASITVFDPTELYSTNANRNRYSLTEAANLAEQNGQNLTVVIPTYRYETNVSQGEADLLQFLYNAVSLQEMHGKTIRLEIGNEYFASDSLTADEYGEMAVRFATVIDEFSGDLVNFETVVQIGKSASDNADILSHFSEDNLGMVDAVSLHMLPINLRNLYNATHSGEDFRRIDTIQSNLSAWEEAASLAATESPTVLMTAWAVGEATDDASSVNLSYQDYGARGGVTSLALFTESIYLGVQEAAAWGMGESGLSSLGRVVNDQVQLTHSGTVLSELNDSVIGLSLSNYSHSQGFEWGTGLEVGKAVYTGLGRMVLYVANGQEEVSSTTRLTQYNEDFSPETATIVEAKRISTVHADGYAPSNNAEDRLYEIPVVEEVLPNTAELALNGEWLSHQQTQAYQVQEITVSWLHTGSDNDETLQGYTYADWFDGGGGNDTLQGHDANDTLLGGQGDDWIEGGAGSDSLYGGHGGDVIFGDDEALTDWHLNILGFDDFSFV